MVSKAADDDFLFLAEDEINSEAETQSSGEWHLLIVDDDEEIHTVTNWLCLTYWFWTVSWCSIMRFLVKKH